MAGMLPASVFGLRVPAGGMPIPAAVDFPATFRITMAALDPSAVPQLDEDYKTPRATLKLIRMAMNEDDYDEDDDEDMDDDDIERIKARLQGIISDEDSDMSDESEDDSEEEKNGGPSDPAKAKAAKRAALAKKIQEELAAEEMELDKPNGVNGKSKGKAKAIEGENSSDDEEVDSDEDDGEETEEFVLCTLDPEKNYQQPLDITVGEHEQVFFCSNGTHDIYLTGNYVLPMDMDDEEDENEDDYDDDDYDLPPDSDELDEVSDSEEDALDSLKDPRIEEIHSEDDVAPKLVKAEKKGKNKRPAEEDAVEDTLDDLISKTVKPEAPATNGEQKLSKKQAKKLKKNDGQAVPAAQEPVKKEQSATPVSDKKKVQFAKNLELGPTGSPKVQEDKKEAPAAAAKSGPRVVGGVTVEDKKVGNGKAAKKGDRIEMRYIGKLKSGKQFDANKKGKPFGFKLGTGEVIKGWDIGIVGMAPGGERRITIPSHLAYGKKALPGIPANSDLIFDVKCIAVN